MFESEEFPFKNIVKPLRRIHVFRTGDVNFDEYLPFNNSALTVVEGYDKKYEHAVMGMLARIHKVHNTSVVYLDTQAYSKPYSDYINLIGDKGCAYAMARDLKDSLLLFDNMRAYSDPVFIVIAAGRVMSDTNTAAFTSTLLHVLRNIRTKSPNICCLCMTRGYCRPLANYADQVYALQDGYFSFTKSKTPSGPHRVENAFHLEFEA